MRDLQRDDVGDRRFPARNPAEVPLRHPRGLLHVDVADQDQRDVLRRVVGAVVGVCLRLRDRRDVGGPADDRPAVRVRLPEERLEALFELSERGRFRAHAALLEDDVALRVELAEDRVEEAVRLHPHPELELVRRHRDEVTGHVFVGERVHPGASGGRVDPVELVLDQDLPLFPDQLVELLLELSIVRGLVLRLQEVVDLAAPVRGAHLRLLLAHFFAEKLDADFEVIWVSMISFAQVLER